MSQQNEAEEPLAQVEQYALEFLRQGRPQWDEPHTRAVVDYAKELVQAARKELAQAAQVDELVVLTAAWLHDIGYFGLFEGPTSGGYQAVSAQKALHMEVGARLADEFLRRPDVAGFYTREQRQRVVHLVRVHDLLEQLEALDEIVLMEADTLGALDVRRVTPTFDYESGRRHLEEVRIRRAPRFQTALGKRYLEEVLPLRVAYFEDLRARMEGALPAEE